MTTTTSQHSLADLINKYLPVTVLIEDSVYKIRGISLDTGVYYLLKGSRTDAKVELLTKAIKETLVKQITLNRVPAGFSNGVLPISGTDYYSNFKSIGETWTEAELDAIYSIGVNPIRNTLNIKNSTHNLTIWGICFITTNLKIDRMFDASGNMALSFERLFYEDRVLPVEKMIKDTVSVYENKPVTEEMLSIIGLLVSDILKNVYPKYETHVVCDLCNNPPSILDKGAFIVDYYIGKYLYRYSPDPSLCQMLGNRIYN